jgi:putative aldouronate transport system substrate-binding protein
VRKKLPFLACICAILVLFSAFSGCTGNKGKTSSETTSAPPQTETKKAQTETSEPQDDVPDYLNETGFPIVKEPLAMTAMVLLSPAQPTEWNDILAWQEYEMMTGIHIEWEAYTSAEIVEKRNLALASDTLPDIFFRTKMPDNDVAKYGAEGSFIKLNELIEKYAPNFKAVMEKYPDVKKRCPDGRWHYLCNAQPY